MKQFTILLTLLLSSVFTFGQVNYIIKKNPGTGYMEVFKSGTGGNSNTPNGAPVMRLKKDPSTGYTIIENLDKKVEIETKINPYNQKPDYNLLNFLPYSMDYSALLNSINITNNFISIKRQAQQDAESNRIQQISENLCNEKIEISNIAESYLELSERNNQTKILKDGWYNCYGINKYKYQFPKNCEVKYEMCFYIVSVKQNKIDEIYFSILTNNISDKSSIFHREELLMSGNIENLKSVIKTPHGLMEMCFTDNIIDIESQIENPNFSKLEFDCSKLPNKHFGLVIDSKKQLNENNYFDSEYISSPYTTLYFKDFKSTYNIYIYSLNDNMTIQKYYKIDNYLPQKNTLKTYNLN